jgi:DNA-dependent RNA polymerase auxiliary subunit epsilon
MFRCILYYSNNNCQIIQFKIAFIDKLPDNKLKFEK